MRDYKYNLGKSRSHLQLHLTSFTPHLKSFIHHHFISLLQSSFHHEYLCFQFISILRKQTGPKRTFLVKKNSETLIEKYNIHTDYPASYYKLMLGAMHAIRIQITKFIYKGKPNCKKFRITLTMVSGNHNLQL